MTFCILIFCEPGVFVRLLYVRRELEAGVFLPRAMRLLSGRGGGGGAGGGIHASLSLLVSAISPSERASERV